MPKLEPSPSRPVTQEQTTNRVEAPAALPILSPSVHGPSTDRLEIRRTLLDLMNERSHRQERPMLAPQPERSILPNTAITHPAPSAQPEAHQNTDTSPQPEAAKPGFFATIKETFLKLTGLHQGHAETTRESESASKGFLSSMKDHFTRFFAIRSLGDFATWAKSLVTIALSPPRLERIIKPVILRDPIESKRAEPEISRASIESLHVTEAGPLRWERERHFWETEAKPVDFTVQALNTVAEAKRVENAEVEKNKHAHVESDRRTKDAARENLKKLAVDGASKADMAAILSELEGVYGTSEVAQRQIRDLIAHRKNFQS